MSFFVKPISYANRILELTKEAWWAARAPVNKDIAEWLSKRVEASRNRCGQSLEAYLRDHEPVGSIETLEDWEKNNEGEFVLYYANPLFGPGRLRVSGWLKNKPLIVYLPGYAVGERQIFDIKNHRQYMRDFCHKLGAGLCSWTWPLQRERGLNCYYVGLTTTISREREYARLLTLLGSSIWREYILELEYALLQIRRLVEPETKLYLIGWSMGGWFAYFSALLGVEVAAVVSVGSLGLFRDLLAGGKARVHGYFYYPLNAIEYFDLDDVVADVLSSGVPLAVLHGEKDHGCLASSSKALQETANMFDSDLFTLQVLPGHGHVYSRQLKEILAGFLSKQMGR